jgi:hypothetical protein
MQPTTCAQWNFTVPFRNDFKKFREEVRQAIGRRVTFRSDKGAFVDKFLPETLISELHANSVQSGVEESSPIGLLVTIKYAPGSKKELEFTSP